MASNPNKRLQSETGPENGLFTPEPSAEPEQVKGMRTVHPSNEQSIPVAAVADSSAQPPPDVDRSAEPAGQSSAVQGMPEESVPANTAAGDVGRAEASADDSSQSQRPVTNTGPTDGAATGESQPPPGISEPQAREVERIMAADPKLPFRILGFEGLQNKDSAEKRYQELLQLLRPENCGHPRASEAVQKLEGAITPYRSTEPVTAGEEFVDSGGNRMDIDSEGGQQGGRSIFPATSGPSNAGDNGSSLFVPDEDVSAEQTTQGTDDAPSTTSEAWPWATGLTHDGKRIMAYRTHGRGHRAVVETEKGSPAFEIRSGMGCGGVEMRRYLAQERTLQLKPPSARRKWSYEHRGNFVELRYVALSDYKTHDTDSKSGGRRKDPEAWGFAQWTWGFEEITASDLRRVVGRESADAAIRAICEKHNRTPPMDRQPQQIVIKTTPGIFAGDRLKQNGFDIAPVGDLPYVSGHSKQATGGAAAPEQTPVIKSEQAEPTAGSDLMSVLRETNKRLEVLEKQVKVVDEISKSTTVLAQIVAKLAEKVGLKVD